MNISEKIKYYTENATEKFYNCNLIKIMKTAQELKRYIKKELRGEKNLIVTSGEMRRWAMSLNKLYKKMLKKLEFDKFQNQFYKYKKIEKEQLEVECLQYKKIAQFAIGLQQLLIEVNYYTAYIFLLEENHRCLKEEDEGLLNDAILSALIEAY